MHRMVDGGKILGVVGCMRGNVSMSIGLGERPCEEKGIFVYEQSWPSGNFAGILERLLAFCVYRSEF